MAKYKILLKKHWKKRDGNTGRKKESEPEPPDLGDLEVEASHRSLYPRGLRYAPPSNSNLRDRIRLYRVISSCAIYAMMFAMLYYSTKFVNTTVSTIRGAKTKEESKLQDPIVSRKMRTNLTQDEEMSMLSYDAFIHKVEEEINNRKRSRIVKVHSKSTKATITNVTLSARKEIGMKAFNERFSSSRGMTDHLTSTTPGASSESNDRVFEAAKPELAAAPAQFKAIPVNGGTKVNPPAGTPNQFSSQSQLIGGRKTSSNAATSLQWVGNFLQHQAIQPGTPSDQRQHPLFQPASSMWNQGNILMPQVLSMGAATTNLLSPQTGGMYSQHSLQHGQIHSQTSNPLSFADSFAGGNQGQSYDAYDAQLQNAIGNSMARRTLNIPSFPQPRFSPTQPL